MYLASFPGQNLHCESGFYINVLYLIIYVILSMDFCSLLGVQSVADVVRCGRLRWFGHLECKSVNDWMSVCRNVVLAGVRCVDRGRKT